MAQFKCQYCGSQQPSADLLEDHEAVHALLTDMGDFLQYKCNVCPASFINNQLLNDHQTKHHPLTCFWCLETFTDLQSLKTHEQCHEIDDEPTSKPLTYFWCLENATDLNELKEHEKSHEIDNDEPSSPKRRKPNNSPETILQMEPNSLSQTESQRDVISPIPGPSSVNQVGAGQSKIAYTIRKVNEKTFKNEVIDRHYKVQFDANEAMHGTKLSDLHNELQGMFDELLNEVKDGLQGNDLGRVVISHPNLTSNIVVSLQQLDDLTGDKVMEYIENVLNSHEDLPLENEMSIDVGTMELPKGAGKKSLPIIDLFGPSSSLKQKRSIIKIDNTDFLCLARAILIGYLKTKTMTTPEWKDLTSHDSHMEIEDLVLKYKACPEWYFKKLLAKEMSHRQGELAYKLCIEVGVSTIQYLSINNILPFEQFFGIDVLVVSSRLSNKFIRVPPEDSQKPRIYVYLVENDGVGHYHTIGNICGFFGESKFCENCLRPYRNKHSCETTCFVCNSRECTIQEDQVSCRFCHMTCRSLPCFERHLERKNRKNKESASKCDLYWKCTQCKKVVETEKRKKEDHQCDFWECKSCHQMVPEGHLCYIRALDVKENKGKFIFFDIETTQNEIWQCRAGYDPVKIPNCKQCKNDALCIMCVRCKNCNHTTCGKYQHQANLIIAQKCCLDCMNEPLLPDSKCFSCGGRCNQCNKFNKDEKMYDTPPCQATCGFREVIFKGYNCVIDFGQWLFSKTHKHFTVLADNMRAFDGYFLLEYLIDQSIRPDSIIFSGSKINNMHIARGLDIRIIDSLNFLPMPLSQLPSAFGLSELQKGYFPHFFNTRANEQYVGPYPDPKFYGADSMSGDSRTKFYSWYNEKLNKNAVFDFAKAIVEYCRSDVDILRRACLKFRQLLLDITGKEETTLNENLEPVTIRKNEVDPFNEITIASVCSKVYRIKFLEETWQVKVRCGGQLSDWLPAKKLDGEHSIFVNDRWVHEKDLTSMDMVLEEKEFVKSPISQIPSSGYVSDQFSKVSIQWLEWEVKKTKRIGQPIFIQHGNNQGEYRLSNTNYRLDGYCAETNTAYEFYGCLWHGCVKCFPNKRHITKLPRTKQSVEELYALTLKKQEYIRSIGMNLVYIWEHEFTELLQNNTLARDFVESLGLQSRLNPRDSFFGGRTNAIKLRQSVEGEQKINYVDFTSLYPYINKYGKYPTGHPEIKTTDLENIDFDHVFGIAKCKILPPRKLYFPVLPVKCNGKLTFPLCRRCSEKQSQKPCRCSDSERMLLGTWCTPEIAKAVQLGYKIVKVYELYKWNETTQFDPSTGTGGLFSQYINLFLRIKQESSDYPSWVQTEEDMLEYIRLYFEKEGIYLNRENIRQNKALRSLAKLLLNSMWGKWGQNLNMSQTVYFHETEADKFFKCIGDPQKNVKDFYIVTDDIIQVTYDQHNDFMEESYQNNVFVATFTTCQARLKLYEVLEMLQERVLYNDTDSVIYISNPGHPEPLLGDYLGQLTSELDPDDWITNFCAGGPKQYAYKTAKGQQVCKIRGFSLNYTNQKLLNYDSMLDLISRPDGSSITLVNPNKICRDKLKRKIYNRIESKKYKIVYTKRVIQKDSFDTLPYGY